MFFQAQIVSKSMAAGASPQTPLGELTALPRPLAVLRGPTSKGWAGKDARRKGRGKGGKAEGRGRGRKELVRLGLSPPNVKFLVTSLNISHVTLLCSIAVTGMTRLKSAYGSPE